MDYEKEYGRYKKKCERLEKKIKELESKAEAYNQLESINLAMIGAIVQKVGEVTIAKETINNAVKRSMPVVCDYNADEGTYTLRLLEEKAE